MNVLWSCSFFECLLRGACVCLRAFRGLAGSLGRGAKTPIPVRRSWFFLRDGNGDDTKYTSIDIPNAVVFLASESLLTI